MRKIFIDNNIKSIADDYREEVLKNLHYGLQNVWLIP